MLRSIANRGAVGRRAIFRRVGNFKTADDSLFRNKERAEESIWIANLEKEIREEERMKARRALSQTAGQTAVPKSATQVLPEAHD